MRTMAIAAGSIVTAAVATLYPQESVGQVIYRADPVAYPECWNPRARHFEAVRPGEIQNDLDFGRCRMVGVAPYEARTYVPVRRECWNPRQGHYELVRPGERQFDLDFGRCRLVRESDLYAYDYRYR